VREGVISYGLSSYGYDLRVADEFKITTVNCTVVDPKNFDERSFVTVRTARIYANEGLCQIPVLPVRRSLRNQLHRPQG
jgi:deoxycytidine triphosphate deaminase